MKAVSLRRTPTLDTIRPVAAPKKPTPDLASPTSRSPARQPSIDDVAHIAGVSTATVSRFLNTPRLVAAATAVRIESAIAELGYRPNRFAQGLMTKRSHVLGIVLPDIHGEFYSELLRGAFAEARARGYHLLVAGSDMGEFSAESIRSGPFGLIDGLAVMMTEPSPQMWRAARATGLPMVTLDADAPDSSGSSVPSILIDNASGAAEAIDHLLASVPADRCWFVGGPADNFDTRHRAAAFSAGLRRKHHEPHTDQFAYGTYSPEWGRVWAAAWLKKHAADRAHPLAPLAVMAGNDEVALGILDTFAQAGLATPATLRIVGFDDSRLASLLRPGLSSVRIPRAEVGAAAIAALVERLESPDAKVSSRTLPTRLVIRDSSRP